MRKSSRSSLQPSVQVGLYKTSKKKSKNPARIDSEFEPVSESVVVGPFQDLTLFELNTPSEEAPARGPEDHVDRRKRKKYVPWTNIFALTHNYIENNFYDGVAIFLSEDLFEKDIVTAIALKKFFIDNGIKAEIVVKLEHCLKFSVDPKYYPEFVESPTLKNFLGYTIGCAHEYEIENQDYRVATETFNIMTGNKDIIRFGVKNLISNEGCVSCVDVIYPEMKNSGLYISEEVVTDLYLAMLCATEKYERKVYGESLKTMNQLILDGANYKDANVRFGSMPLAVLECHALMHKHIKVNGDMARIIVPFGEGSKECTRLVWEKAVKAYRNTDNINIWCVQIQEEDGAYYSIVQAKNNQGYDLTKVARRNNGNGTESFIRCIIYSFDLDKLTHDIREMMRQTKALKEAS